MKDLLLENWRVNLDYGLRLVEDLPDAQMVCQPALHMNHASWVLCHLCHYHPAILALITAVPLGINGGRPGIPDADTRIRSPRTGQRMAARSGAAARVIPLSVRQY